MPRPYEEDASYDVKVMECLHIAAAFERAAEFDVLHNHFDFLPLSYSRLVRTPLVTTVHGLSSPAILPAYREYDDTVTYVAISDADRHPDLTYAATVHHGIPVQDVPLGDGSHGRDAGLPGPHPPDKGTAAAIEVARRSGRPLVLAGIVQDEAYFREQVLPHVDGERVRYVGPVGPQERDRLLGAADALLHLVGFAEPFGLSMVEAMACGTPVVGHPLGAVPEVVADGVTGWLVDDLDAAVAAVGRLGELDRAACRRRVEERFSVEQMVAGYLQVYEQLLGSGRG